MDRILLHCCCAPCSAAIVEWMLREGIHPTLYYYNPNIYPREEYEVRKGELTRYAVSLGLEVLDGDYEHETWLCQVAAGREQEPERGARCLACFKMRLLQTASVAAAQGFDTIATTLASSRWKSLQQIEEAGRWAVEPYPQMVFWAKNWRKDGLQQRRQQLLQENGFYNQLYCGCEFSLRK